MTLLSIGQRRSRATAQEQFSRFLSLNRERYSKLIASGSLDLETVEFTVPDHQAVAKACRQWLTHLTDSVDRDICCAIAQFHDSSSSHGDALEYLQIALLAELERERPSPAPYGCVPAEITFPPYALSSSSSTN